MRHAILALGMPGSWEWIVILIVALVIFGRRLPDVARSIGKSIVEFKKGIRDVSDDIDDNVRLDKSKPNRLDQSTAESRSSAKSNHTETTSTKNDN